VERFNGRISEVLATTYFRCHDDLQTTLERYENSPIIFELLSSFSIGSLARAGMFLSVKNKRF
jgi:hypothetical protein